MAQELLRIYHFPLSLLRGVEAMASVGDNFQCPVCFRTGRGVSILAPHIDGFSSLVCTVGDHNCLSALWERKWSSVAEYRMLSLQHVFHNHQQWNRLPVEVRLRVASNFAPNGEVATSSVAAPMAVD